MGIAERKEREKQLRKAEIVTAAEKIFFSRGPEETTMEEIAAEAELSKGTIYLYFKSKEDLHREVALRASERLIARADYLDKKELSALEKLFELGKIFIEFTKSNPGYLKVILFTRLPDFERMTLSKEEIREVIYRDSPVRLVLDFVRQGVEQKQIRDDINPLIIANTLWSQMLGVVQLAIVNKGLLELVDMDPEVLFQSHLELVLNGIKK